MIHLVVIVLAFLSLPLLESLSFQLWHWQHGTTLLDPGMSPPQLLCHWLVLATPFLVLVLILL